MFVYNFLAAGLESGHLILDDTYWVSVFKEHLQYFFSSNYSCKVQINKYPQYSNKIKVIPEYILVKKFSYKLNNIFRCVTVPVPRNSKILIQGFEEFSILFFIIRAKLKGNNVFLILTNNISNYRINSKRFFLRFLLKIIFSLSDKIIYHTNYEKKLIDKYILKFDEKKFIFIKYHLLTTDPNSDKYKIDYSSTKKISFFGPIKVDKPIEPFLDLIKSDKECKFSYRIYNPGKQHIESITKTLTNFNNIEIFDELLSFENYDRAVEECAIIFLSHNDKYEGKLSGNICDCISKRKPFISNNISPVNEFVKEFGIVGFIHDFQMDKNWATKFLNSIDERTYYNVLENLKNLQLNFTSDKLLKDLESVFN